MLATFALLVTVFYISVHGQEQKKTDEVADKIRSINNITIEKLPDEAVINSVVADNVALNDREPWPENLCLKKTCDLGYECQLDKSNVPVCECQTPCPRHDPAYTPVCSTDNVTFPSDCDLYRQRCLCSNGLRDCDNPLYAKAQLDYHGPCKAIPECLTGEKEEFPERMRDWLFRVMDELARRKDFSEKEIKLTAEARNHPKQWLIPIIWKFCDLDKSGDKQVTREELLAISAFLKPLEHCTGPFLDKCDLNANSQITLQEWGACLGLTPDEIEDRCDSLKD